MLNIIFLKRGSAEPGLLQPTYLLLPPGGISTHQHTFSMFRELDASLVTSIMGSMKRIAADRPGWERILEKRFYCSYMDTPGFTGSIALLCMDSVREPLLAKSSRLPVCIVDNGYSWLQHYPHGEHHTLTTMFDGEGVIVQWYIDICLQHGVTSENIPWLDDLFLDIIVSPTGDIEMLKFAEAGNKLFLNLLVLHDDGEREFAYQQGAEKALNIAKERNWQVVSMKTDWRVAFSQASPY